MGSASTSVADTDVTRRVSKALRILKLAGDVRSSVDTKGNLMWSLRALAR
jgi:hypothetical protein